MYLCCWPSFHLASWLAIRKRSRRGLLWLSVFSLIYFGFYRDGCICSIGAIQNVALSIFDPAYAISIDGAALLFTAAAVCPVFWQDLLCGCLSAGSHPGPDGDQSRFPFPAGSGKPWDLSRLSTLDSAVLFAATGSDFIICRYDPFVGIFRMDGPFLMIFLGITFLLLGMFYARPYCRVFCPYGVILSWLSRFSKWHLTITPSECIKCKLCKDSCPFDAIEVPADQEYRNPEVSRKNLRKFILYIALIPVSDPGGRMDRIQIPYIPESGSSRCLPG